MPVNFGKRRVLLLFCAELMHAAWIRSSVACEFWVKGVSLCLVAKPLAVPAAGWFRNCCPTCEGERQGRSCGCDTVVSSGGRDRKEKEENQWRWKKKRYSAFFISSLNATRQSRFGDSD